MPKGYFQCAKCGARFSTTYKIGELPQVECNGKDGVMTHMPRNMKFMGNGWEGRENFIVPEGKTKAAVKP